MSNLKIGIIGLGFVGSAIYNSFKQNNIKNISIYDKYKNGGIGSINDIIKTDILFLALPTRYIDAIKQYDKEPIINTCKILIEKEFKGVIVIKSTVEPETTSNLSKRFPLLQFIHNPEFLSAKTAFHDFHNQKHIVLGKGPTCSDKYLKLVKLFYIVNYPNSQISISTSDESESMKIYCNAFYAMKVQIFTEFYQLCQKNKTDFNKIKEMMLKNDWINSMHTNVPGPDGKISYGGLCFPKDTNALNNYMEIKNSNNKVLKATIEERNELRNDHLNCEINKLEIDI